MFEELKKEVTPCDYKACVIAGKCLRGDGGLCTYKKAVNVNFEELKNAYPEYGMWIGKFIDAMNDDFNTPRAIAVLFDMIRQINILLDKKALETANEIAIVLIGLGSILNLFQEKPADFLLDTKEKIKKLLDGNADSTVSTSLLNAQVALIRGYKTLYRLEQASKDFLLESIKNLKEEK